MRNVDTENVTKTSNMYTTLHEFGLNLNSLKKLKTENVVLNRG